ncbi:Atg12 protein [Saccharomycopsis crataegensis]|uniref:Ubiquitin-like protein ATG12 n=1 Tax=Saccharomycopsis crataegensis TaxID=43959 RepID=A0AAV5QWV2_9ASCO|nr:Atg12 protein [Saccharomycopsis crataegensis]
MNPLLSEDDDDSSSSNYQDSTDSSMILDTRPGSAHNNNSLVNSRINLSSSNDNVLQRLNQLALQERSNSATDNDNDNENENDNTTNNNNYNNDSDDDVGNGSSNSIKDVRVTKNKLSIMNSQILENLSKSFYYENEHPISEPSYLSVQQAQDQQHSSSIETTVPIAQEHNKQEIIEQILKPYEETKPQKILIRFQSIGSTRQIEPRVYKISNNQQFSSLIRFLHKKFKLGDRDGHVFCYIHNSFSPNPDEIIGDLFKNFAINNELVVSYCENVAFG